MSVQRRHLSHPYRVPADAPTTCDSESLRQDTVRCYQPALWAVWNYAGVHGGGWVQVCSAHIPTAVVSLTSDLNAARGLVRVQRLERAQRRME